MTTGKNKYKVEELSEEKRKELHKEGLGTDIRVLTRPHTENGQGIHPLWLKCQWTSML
jgi:hypothetical protein